jgi:hypothetical protein
VPKTHRDPIGPRRRELFTAVHTAHRDARSRIRALAGSASAEADERAERGP